MGYPAGLHRRSPWSDNVKVAVNLPAAQFRKPGLVQVVISALASSGLAPQCLELEITESILLEDSAATLATLHRLRDFGSSLSLKVRFGQVRQPVVKGHVM